jgi:hypothetical protein
MSIPPLVKPPVQKPGERCWWCPTRPGFSEAARHIYGIDDAICEHCDGTGFVQKKETPCSTSG